MDTATSTPDAIPPSPRRNAVHVVRNGTLRSGSPNLLCRGCGRNFVAAPKKGPVAEDCKELTSRLLLERLGLRGIARVAGVSRSCLQGFVNGLYREETPWEPAPAPKRVGRADPGGGRDLELRRQPPRGVVDLGGPRRRDLPGVVNRRRRRLGVHRSMSRYDVSSLRPERTELGKGEFVESSLTGQETRLLASPVGMKCVQFGEAPPQLGERTYEVRSLPGRELISRSTVTGIVRAELSSDHRSNALLVGRNEKTFDELGSPLRQSIHLVDSTSTQVASKIVLSAKSWERQDFSFSSGGRALSVYYERRIDPYEVSKPEPTEPPVNVDLWELHSRRNLTTTVDRAFHRIATIRTSSDIPLFQSRSSRLSTRRCVSLADHPASWVQPAAG